MAQVLLVDDDPMMLRCAQRYLGRMFGLDTAISGEDALEMIADHGAYAVVLSDMSMPEMNGKEFLRRARVRTPESIYFLLTGNQDFLTNDQAESNLDGLIDRFISKPCDPDALAEAIRWGIEEFDRRSVAREAGIIEVATTEVVPETV